MAASTLHRKIVGVMGSGKDEHPHLAKVVAEVVAQCECHLLTGAGKGVMKSVAEAFTSIGDRKGLSIGIVRAGDVSVKPDGSRSWTANALNDFTEIAIKTHLPFSDESERSRNHINALTSDVVIVLPGDKGTASELSLAVQYGRSIILFIGNEKVNGRTGAELREIYPGIPQPSTQEELKSAIERALGRRGAIEKTIRAYAAAWAARDREGWLGTFADLAAQEDPIGERTRRGREEIGEFWDDAMSAYQSIEIVPRDIFVAGREAAMEWTINAATPEGTVTFDGVDVFTFDEAARIVSVRAYWERDRIRDRVPA